MKMKLFFLLFLVVLLWSNNNALRCVNYTNQVIFEASNLTAAKGFINNLPTAEGYRVCTIIYGVLYPAKSFAAIFGQEIRILGVNVNMDVLYHITLTMASNGSIVDPAEGENLLWFMCDDQDTCDRQFWHDHIDWFIREESILLEAALRSIFITEIKEKVECTVEPGNNEETCLSDACVTVNNYLNVQGMQRACAEKDIRATSIQLLIKISFSTNVDAEDRLIMEESWIYLTYICQFDNCNNKLTENKIKEAFNSNLNLSSMRQVFSTKLQEIQTTKLNTESISYSTTSEAPDISTFTSLQTTSTTHVPSTPIPPQTESMTPVPSTPIPPQTTSTTPVPSTPIPRQTTSTTPVPSTSIPPQTTSTIRTSSTTTYEQTTSQPINNSILHFISMNILILHILFLMFF